MTGDRPSRPWRIPAAAAAAVFLTAAGCSSTSTPTTAATLTATVTATISASPTATPPRPSSPAGSVTAATTGTASHTRTSPPASAPAGCAATGGGIPAGAVHRSVVDVDGDGRPDTLWLSPPAGGVVRIGITTASGATFSTLFDSPSPDPRSVLLARPVPGGPVVVLASDGRLTGLLTVAGCALRAVTDTHGTPYLFDVADLRGGGTGVGCEGPGNRVGLTGLNAVSTDGRYYTIIRTFITVTGTVARNGVSDTVHAMLPRDRAEVDTAHAVTCGTLTFTHGGLTVDA